MNICEKLLAADPKAVEELAETKFASRQIAKALGVSGTVDITLREIPGDRLKSLHSKMYDTSGKMRGDMNDLITMMCVDSIVDPDVKNPDLAKHFGCSTPKELVDKLFGFETLEISDKIYELCGLGPEAEDEVKN